MTYQWTPALAQGGTLARYELWLDGVITSAGNATQATRSTPPGRHVWRVRAVNSLGNAGGWSVAQTFTAQ